MSDHLTEHGDAPDLITTLRAEVERLTQEREGDRADRARILSAYNDCAASLRSAEAELAEARKLYQELLFAVERKWPGESRHQTALRYIREREMPTNQTGQGAAMHGKEKL